MTEANKKTWETIYNEQKPEIQRYIRALNNKIIHDVAFSNQSVKVAYNKTFDPTAMEAYALALIRGADEDAATAYNASSDKSSLEAFADAFHAAVANEPRLSIGDTSQKLSR